MISIVGRECVTEEGLLLAEPFSVSVSASNVVVRKLVLIVSLCCLSDLHYHFALYIALLSDHARPGQRGAAYKGSWAGGGA